MRSGLTRVAAAFALLAVLAGGAPKVSGLAEVGPQAAGHPDTYMGALPGPKASAALSAVPQSSQLPMAIGERLATPLPLRLERPARKARAAPAPPKSPPTVLRV
jgi:hypothetical protein